MEEKIDILAELDAAGSRAAKREIMDRHGVTKQAVYQWRKAHKRGTLGGKRGPNPNPEMEREIARLEKRPEVLDKILEADSDLAGAPNVPTPKGLSRSIVDDITQRVDDEEVPWDGEISQGWDERLSNDLKSRVSRRRRKEREDPSFVHADYLGELPTNTRDELCRRDDCPCTRLCHVFHIHSREVGQPSDPATINIEKLRPEVIVCSNMNCAINSLCYLPGTGTPVHVIRHRGSPSMRRGQVKPIAEWTSPEDCPWFGVCDVRHERPDESEMEVFDQVQGSWQPPKLWCVDPDCKRHHRGAPHVHCRKCDTVFPAFYRDREIDLTTMARDTLTETDGLCEICYMKWKKKTLTTADRATAKRS